MSRAHTPDSVRRIAVPVLAGVGNALLAQPMVRQLRQAFADAQLAVFARGQAIAEVFARLEDVHHVEAFDTRPSEFARLIRRMRAWNADICVIPYPSNRWQYSILAATCGARHAFLHGYAVGYWRAMHFLPGERVPVVEGLHDLKQSLRLLEPLGITPDPSMAPVFPLAPAEIERAAAALPAGECIAIHAGSGKTVFGDAKRWDPRNYSLLIDRLRSELRLTPLLIEGPDEAGVAEEIRPRGDVPVIRFRGALAEAAATLASCRLYVGNDSGLAHLAAAVGTPPVTLFGPARPDELCPLGYRHLVVQTPAACAPCFGYPTRAVTPHVACRPPYCINLIALQSVIEKVREALEAQPPAESGEELGAARLAAFALLQSSNSAPIAPPPDGSASSQLPLRLP